MVSGVLTVDTKYQKKMSKKFITKDSGKRQEYETGMRRDLQDGKPRYDLIIGLKHKDHMLKRWAELLERGMEKYGYRNWELASTEEELIRFKASAFRHLIQWFSGEEDEDHAAAVFFNINAAEYVKEQMTTECQNCKVKPGGAIATEDMKHCGACKRGLTDHGHPGGAEKYALHLISKLEKNKADLK